MSENLFNNPVVINAFKEVLKNASEKRMCNLIEITNQFNLPKLDCGNLTCFNCHNNVIKQLEELEAKAQTLETKKEPRLKEEANEHIVKYTNLDGLSLLKDKLVEKYNVLFNKCELTEFEQGELRATTEMLYSIDDIVEKQAISDKTSYIEEQMRELSRKPLHDAETIARALEKVNNQSDKQIGI